MEDTNSTALKLRELGEKMASLNFSQEREGQQRLESIQEHIRKLEDSFNKQRPAEESKLQLLKDQIQRSAEVVRTELMRISSKSSAIQERIANHKGTVLNFVQLERQKQDADKNGRADINSNQLMTLCSMIEKQEGGMYDTFEEVYSDVTARVNRLKEELHRQESDREDNVIRIADSIESELGKFKQMIGMEQSQRTESEGRIRVMVGEIRGKLRQEVEKQAKRRAECNNLMLGLLETACQKMERRR